MRKQSEVKSFVQILATAWKSCYLNPSSLDFRALALNQYTTFMCRGCIYIGAIFSKGRVCVWATWIHSSLSTVTASGRRTEGQWIKGGRESFLPFYTSGSQPWLHIKITWRTFTTTVPCAHFRSIKWETGRRALSLALFSKLPRWF